MCTSGLVVLAHKGVSGERSTRDDERLTRKYDLVKSVLMTHKGVFFICSSLGKIIF